MQANFKKNMKRRDLLKGISLSSLGLVGLNPQVQAAEILDPYPLSAEEKKDPVFEQFGRTEYEKIRDAKLFAEQFFNKHELKTIKVLVDIIIPRDGRSGSASDAGAVEFIEFMAKDKPDMQTPLRGGLTWLDNQSKRRYEKNFIDLEEAERIAIVEDIAYPERKKPGMSQGIVFFSLMRNLTASGFWSSKIGIEDIGFQGNTPNQWDGPPADVLRQYGL
jgi:gluconate 2-dehydrogenase gamma chain